MNLPAQPHPAERVEGDIGFQHHTPVRRTPPTTHAATPPRRRHESALALVALITAGVVLFTHGPFAAAVAAYLVLFSGIMALALWAWVVILTSPR